MVRDVLIGRGEGLLSPYAARVSPFQWFALTAVLRSRQRETGNGWTAGG